MKKTRKIDSEPRPSLNALRHGLTGKTVFLPGEDLDEYNQHCDAAFADLQPQSLAEEQLVRNLVDISWRLRRAAAVQINILATDYTCSRLKELNLLGAYEERLSRKFHKTLSELQRLKKADAPAAPAEWEF